MMSGACRWLDTLAPVQQERGSAMCGASGSLSHLREHCAERFLDGFAGIMGSVVQGMALGTGSALAGRAMDSVMGPRQVEHVHTNNAPAAPGQHSFSLCYCRDV